MKFVNNKIDTTIIMKIMEIINIIINKIKNLIFPESKDNFEFYYQLNDEFDKISFNLKSDEILYNEYVEFLEIKDHVLYIVYHNCEDNAFGHLDFAIDLLTSFNELLSLKIDLIHDFSQKKLESYNLSHNTYKKRIWQINKYFYTNIYDDSNLDISDEEMYSLMKQIKW
ncbi:MAG: hypothetical protein IJQ68_06745 [Methanobrevibacter sp.]|uniref:hypothetical protein n=1 Tax=Methanobrevibacter sp. TaxID=66852 RepID=UPI0025E4B9A3|nr:hypothetical protein [Methanobrevibacter sp.]MBR0271669.1 hypothetical protein [Methanobrevibacter sp.]